MRRSGPLRPFPLSALLVLAAASAVLAQDPPVLGPVFPMHAPSVVHAYQATPALASDGSDFLAVWTESEAENRILARRVRASDGAFLDPEPLVIGAFRSFQCLPTAASTGDGFLVVWEDHGEATGSDIFAARVIRGEDGRLAVSTLLISGEEGEQTAPTVAASRHGYLVAWEDYRGDAVDIRAARVGGGPGSAVSPSFPVETGPWHKFRPVAASAGGDFLVAWEDLRDGGPDAYGRRIRGEDGALLDPSAIPLAAHPGDQTNLALASNGEDYLLAWEDYRLRGSADVYAARVRARDGAVLDPLGITVGAAEDGQVLPVVASSGGDFLVAWEDYRSGLGETDMRGTRLAAADGSLLESDLLMQGAPGAQYAPALASVEGLYLLAWQDAGPTGYEFRVHARSARFDEDSDRDGVRNGADNCRHASNPGQEDLDGDRQGDACDPDDDGDAVPDGSDNCPLVADATQADSDGDGIGDACDPVLPIAIDVDPASRKNRVRVECGQWVQVVILGSEGFDPSRIRPASVRFAGAAPKRHGHGGYHMWYQDANRDGRKDLWLKFKGEETTLRPGDTEATLEGALLDGTAFSGTDRVLVTR